MSSQTVQLLALIKLNGLSASLSYAFTLYLANLFGPEKFGQYTAAMLYGMLAAQFVVYGTDVTAVSLFARRQSVESAVSTITAIRVFGLIPLLILVLVVYYTGDFTRALGIAAIGLSGLGLSYLYEIRGQNIKYASIYLVERLVYLLLALMAVKVLGDSIVAIFLCLALTMVASVGYQAWDNRAALSSLRMPRLARLADEYRDHTWVVLLTLSNFTYGGFGRLIVEVRFGEKELGLYAVAWQLVLVSTIVQTQATRAWRKPITLAVENGDLPRLRRTVGEYLVGTTLPLCVAAAFGATYSAEIVEFLFGERYLGTAPLLVIFAAYLPIVNLDALATILWIGSGQSWRQLTLSSMFSLIAVASMLFANWSSIEQYALAVPLIHGTATVVLLASFYRYLRGRAYAGKA